MAKRYLSRRAELELEEMLSRSQPKPPQAEQHAESEEEAAPQQRGLNAWNRLVEQRIQDAMAQGMFDNLHGMGQPLNLNDDAYVPAELRMAFRMLRSNGLAPLWIEINKEIRADIQRLYRFRDHVHGRWERLNPIEYRHLREEYETRILEINGKILSYNIQAPSVQVHLDMLILEDELEKFDTPPQS